MSSNMAIRDPWVRNFPRDSFFGPFEQVFDQLLNEFKGPNFFDKVKSNSGFPKLNIWQDNESFVIDVNIAGVSPEDLKIEIEDDLPCNLIRITGQAHMEEPKTEKGYWQPQYWVKELTQRQFTREIRLPEYITGEPEATHKNGIISLKWKMPPPPDTKKKIKTINVQQE